MLCAGVALTQGRQDVASFLSSSSVSFETVLDVHPHFVAQAAAGSLPVLFRTVNMTARIEPGFLIDCHPALNLVSRWRAECGVSRKRRARSPARGSEDTKEDVFESVLLELPARAHVEKLMPYRRGGPPQMQRQEDPVKSVRGLAYANFLKNVEEFGGSLDAGQRYDRDDDDDDSDIVRDATGDAHVSKISRRKRRMDAVGMCLERRLFHADMATDGIRTISVYSDASPVSGAEIQGMILEFVKHDDSVRQCILPASALRYGHQDVVAKTMAFVWAVWLCCGPLVEHLNYFSRRWAQSRPTLVMNYTT